MKNSKRARLKRGKIIYFSMRVSSSIRALAIGATTVASDGACFVSVQSATGGNQIVAKVGVPDISL